MLKSTLALLALTLGFAAHAAPTQTAASSSQSEYFHQTAEKTLELTPSFEYRNATMKFKDNGGKLDINGMQFKLQYERGLNSMFAVGAFASYATMNSKASGTTGIEKSESKGLEDLNFFVKGYSDLQNGHSLWFGANLLLSLGDHEYKEKSADKAEANSFTGGHILTPYVGYSVLVDTLTFGGKVSTEINLGDQTSKNTDVNGDTTKVKESGGETHTLSLFLETPMVQGIYGASLGYTSSNTTTQSPGGELSGVNRGQLTLYGTHAANETTTLRGEVSYGTILGDVTGLKSSNFITAQIAGRFTF